MTVLANLSPSVSAALDERSKYLRRLVVRALDKGERGHIGSTMSLIETSLSLPASSTCIV